MSETGELHRHIRALEDHIIRQDEAADRAQALAVNTVNIMQGMHEMLGRLVRLLETIKDENPTALAAHAPRRRPKEREGRRLS
jgi:hypothetical protein